MANAISDLVDEHIFSFSLSSTQISFIDLSLFHLSISFQLRTLKAKILHDAQPSPATFDAYGNTQGQQYDYTAGRKRKLYFLFLVASLQVVFSLWLSWHLIPSAAAPATPAAPS